MRLDNEKPSDNIEDRRGQGGGGGGFGFPGGGGGRINIPMGGRGGGFSLSTIILLVIAYFAIKLIFGIDLLSAINGGGFPGGGSDSQITIPGGDTNVADGGQSPDATVPGTGTGTSDVTTTDAGKDFVARVLGSTERVWGKVFKDMGGTYEQPKLVLFTGFVQSACGMAQSAMGPFYCPGDHKVYIDLAFYQDMKTKLGAPGDFAQAYVVAHEVGHHVQNLLGILPKAQEIQRSLPKAEANHLQVQIELQADCFAGVWAHGADERWKVIEPGDIQAAMQTAAAIGDDKLQKQARGYVVPDSFTHGTSAQRQHWFETGLKEGTIAACNTFRTAKL